MRVFKEFPSETNQPVTAIPRRTEHKVVAFKAGDGRVKVVGVQLRKVGPDQQGAAIGTLAQQELPFHPAAQIASPL